LIKKDLIQAFKDDSGDIEVFKQYVHHIITYQGDENQILPAMQLGARGAVGSTGNITRLIEKIISDRDQLSQDLITKFRPIITVNLKKGSEAIKYVLWKKDICQLYVAKSQGLTVEEMAAIDAILTKLEVNN
jgi:dihydrodipicolinate synthase/N-acetylneuraminate lyase